MICHKNSLIRQSYHFATAFSRVFLQMVDILNTVEMLHGQVTFVTKVFELLMKICPKFDLLFVIRKY